MADQYIALVEETTRGTDPGSGYLYLPVMSNLIPTFNATDEPRQEFRGADSALGANEDSIVRRESQVTYTLECAYYPGAETGLLFKHLLGKQGTRAAEDTSAFKGPLYPLSQPYGTGNELAEKAIGIYSVFDLEGIETKRYYGGLRVSACTITGEGTDDVKLTFELKGPGEYVGADAVNDLTPTFPVADPFVVSDVLCYAGTGATLTGTAPDYTEIAPNTMSKFCPDSLNISITNGLDDKTVLCGVQGPSKTHRSAQFSATIGTPIDYEDQSSGFSSYDEYYTIFAGPSTQSLMFVMDNGQLAGDTTATYESTFYFDAMLRQHETPQYSPDGTEPSVALSWVSLNSDTTEKPMNMQTIDKASAY
jgi:hypothetical protein